MLIIEDETFIAIDLETLVESLGHRVIGVARTHSEAIKLAKSKQPGLILADIQLADGSSGLDAVNELLRTFEVPVIFITAYPERFLTGERPEPAFLISKPFQPAMVSAIARQALFFERSIKRSAPGAYQPRPHLNNQRGDRRTQCAPPPCWRAPIQTNGAQTECIFYVDRDRSQLCFKQTQARRISFNRRKKYGRSRQFGYAQRVAGQARGAGGMKYGRQHKSAPCS